MTFDKLHRRSVWFNFNGPSKVDASIGTGRVFRVEGVDEFDEKLILKNLAVPTPQKAAEAVYALPPIILWNEENCDPKEKMLELLRSNQGFSLTSPPGCGKSFLCKEAIKDLEISQAEM